jgi:hypothetical protein
MYSKITLGCGGLWDGEGGICVEEQGPTIEGMWGQLGEVVGLGKSKMARVERAPALFKR